VRVTQIELKRGYAWFSNASGLGTRDVISTMILGIPIDDAITVGSSKSYQTNCLRSWSSIFWFTNVLAFVFLEEIRDTFA